MKAITYERYGQAHLTEAERPAVGDGSLLIRVRAASVNPYDWHNFTGTPYFLRMSTGLRRPKDHRLGVDFAGTVEAVGPSVRAYAPGDEVFGNRLGAFAEYISVPEDGRIARKPPSVSFEDAAAAPIAAVTALQGLRSVQAGDSVLVIGAGGGIGTYAVQLAAARGAVVTGVCSTGKAELVRSLGAKEVIDYTVAAPPDSGYGDGGYDLILDNVGTLPLRDRLRLLGPAGRLVVVSGPKKNRVLGPLAAMGRIMASARLRGTPASVLFTAMNADDLGTVADLLAAGTLTSVVDRRVSLAEAPQALQHIGTGHARGKVVIVV
jgi:NADPH:quinone reductase-like Zn-dependent oxidoreductase